MSPLEPLFADDLLSQLLDAPPKREISNGVAGAEVAMHHAGADDDQHDQLERSVEDADSAEDTETPSASVMRTAPRRRKRIRDDGAAEEMDGALQEAAVVPEAAALFFEMSSRDERTAAINDLEILPPDRRGMRVLWVNNEDRSKFLTPKTRKYSLAYLRLSYGKETRPDPGQQIWALVELIDSGVWVYACLHKGCETKSKKFGMRFVIDQYERGSFPELPEYSGQKSEEFTLTYAPKKNE